MADIASTRQIAEKWSRVTPGRTTDYQNGVRNPRRNWEINTVAASSAYDAGVQAAIARGAFAAGVSRVGNDKWQSKSETKGVERWGPGVRAATSDFEAGFAPYRDIIERLNLPPRGPKGDPRNLERVAVIANALHQRKLELQAGRAA